MGKLREIQIPILPVVDGCITVTITASAFLYGDTEVVEICTKVSNLQLIFYQWNQLYVVPHKFVYEDLEYIIIHVHVCLSPLHVLNAPVAICQCAMNRCSTTA